MRRLIGLLVMVELTRTVTRRYTQQLRDEAHDAAAAVFVEMLREYPYGVGTCPRDDGAP